MTTIRKIVTSKVDGNSADSNDINEIRPFGEIAVYLNTEPNPDKLTLMMFDGTRTHLKSMVLAPGRLYGSDADSGDGNNRDTIKLIPDASLSDYTGNDQYLIIDPTNGEPGHIHIRAGGVQDQSTADLYLGGERTFVRVSDTYDNVAIGTTGTNANSWVFGSDGLLTLPSGNTTIGNFFGSDAILSSAGTAFGILSQSTGSSVLQWIDNISAPNVVAGIAANGPYGSTGSVQIYTGVIGIPPQHAWTFSDDGKLTLPGAGVIDGSDYDVEIIAGNDGSSTFGSVTINTQAPPAVYTVVQQWSPFNLDTISTDASETPYIASIVPGMTVTGAGITATTTVTNVTGPDEYGAFFISVSPASETGLNYNETYTFTSAGGVTNRNWEFNSLGEIYLPRGGVIQETDVTNEAFGTTTTSLTLVPAGAANGTQRLEIYGTAGGEGNHIHITSGDQNQTDLFLGNDTQYFAVGAMGENEIRARRGADSPSPGTGAESGSPVWIYAGNAGDNGGNTVDGAPGGDILLQSGVSSTGLGGEIILISANGPAGFGSVKLSTDGGSSHLEFDQNNTLTFPSGGGIIFDSSATSTITGVSEVIFADGTTQTTAWLAGTVSSVETISQTTFIPETGTFTNTNQLTVSHQAHAADVGFTFTIDYQSPLDETKGVTVGAINTPLILSTSSVKVRSNLSTSTEWTFGTNGSLTFPDGSTQTTAYGFVTPPLSSTSTGVVGALAKDATYFYVCTATNSWQRIAWDSNPW